MQKLAFTYAGGMLGGLCGAGWMIRYGGYGWLVLILASVGTAAGALIDELRTPR